MMLHRSLRGYTRSLGRRSWYLHLAAKLYSNQFERRTHLLLQMCLVLNLSRSSQAKEQEPLRILSTAVAELSNSGSMSHSTRYDVTVSPPFEVGGEKETVTREGEVGSSLTTVGDLGSCRGCSRVGVDCCGCPQPTLLHAETRKK